jgi:hypothetical protein
MDACDVPAVSSVIQVFTLFDLSLHVLHVREEYIYHTIFPYSEVTI